MYSLLLRFLGKIIIHIIKKAADMTGLHVRTLTYDIVIPNSGDEQISKWDQLSNAGGRTLGCVEADTWK